MKWILDSSFFLATVLPNEQSGKAFSFFLNEGKRGTLCVPALWWAEIANRLTMGRRKSDLSHAATERILNVCSRLNLETDRFTGIDALRRYSELAMEFTLTAYDAVYLELALRFQGGLATLDRELAVAAHKADVAVFPSLEPGIK